MIVLTRIRTQAAILPKYRGKMRIKHNLELLKQQQSILKGTKTDFVFTKIWGEAKKQLMIESNYKCAYCEKVIDTIGQNQKESSFADVEHYRPKSIYWWLAYCYENYLYACEICNRSYKNDKFLILNTRQLTPSVKIRASIEQLKIQASRINPDSLNQKQGQRWAKFKQLHQNERPFLLNPYYDIPSDFFIYEADDVLKEVKMTVAPHIPNDINYQNAIDNDLGLNRISLRQDRFGHYAHWETYKELLKEPLSISVKGKVLQEIKRMQEPNYPYSGMIRYFESL